MLLPTPTSSTATAAETGQLWQALSYLPTIWAALLSVGLTHHDLASVDRFRGRPQRASEGNVLVDRRWIVWNVYRVLVPRGHRTRPNLPGGAPGRICPDGYHRRGDSGCVMVGDRAPFWSRNRGAFRKSRLDRSCLCLCVLHHSRLYGSSKSQEAAYRRPCHLLSAGAYRIYHRRVVFMGHVPRRCASASSTEG